MPLKREKIDQLEHQVRGVSGSTVVHSKLHDIETAFKELHQDCEGQSHLEDMARTLKALGVLLSRAVKDQGRIDEKLEALMLQSLKALRPKVGSVIENYREMFLTDHDRIFFQLRRASEQLTAEPAKLIEESDFMAEMFRLFHTIKGNASALGFDAIAEFTHLIEEFFHNMHRGRIAKKPELALFLADCGFELQRALESCKPKSSVHWDSADAIQRARAFFNEASLGEKKKNEFASPESSAPSQKSSTGLSSSLFLVFRLSGKRFAVCCDWVFSVLSDPKILPSPRPKKEWLGLVWPSMAPLLASDKETKNSSPKWVVLFLKQAYQAEREAFFSVPVDEIEGVFETSQLGSEEKVHFLDIALLVEKTLVKNSA